MDASRRGDDRGKEGVTQGVGRVAIPIFLNLRPSPLIEREIKVLMEQGAIQRGVVFDDDDEWSPCDDDLLHQKQICAT